MLILLSESFILGCREQSEDLLKVYLAIWTVDSQTTQFGLYCNTSRSCTKSLNRLNPLDWLQLWKQRLFNKLQNPSLLIKISLGASRVIRAHMILFRSVQHAEHVYIRVQHVTHILPPGTKSSREVIYAKNGPWHFVHNHLVLHSYSLSASLNLRTDSVSPFPPCTSPILHSRTSFASALLRLLALVSLSRCACGLVQSLSLLHLLGFQFLHFFGHSRLHRASAWLLLLAFLMHVGRAHARVRSFALLLLLHITSTDLRNRVALARIWTSPHLH